MSYVIVVPRLCVIISVSCLDIIAPGAPEGPKGRGGTPEKRALGPRFRGHSPNLEGTLPLLALQKLIRFVKQFIPRILLS